MSRLKISKKNNFFLSISYSPLTKHTSIEGKDNNFVYWHFLSPWNVFLCVSYFFQQFLWQTEVKEKGNCLSFSRLLLYFMLFSQVTCIFTHKLINVGWAQYRWFHGLISFLSSDIFVLALIKFYSTSFSAIMKHFRYHYGNQINNTFQFYSYLYQIVFDNLEILSTISHPNRRSFLSIAEVK